MQQIKNHNDTQGLLATPLDVTLRSFPPLVANVSADGLAAWDMLFGDEVCLLLLFYLKMLLFLG
jgi:hypothetical protein